ncbi:MAG: DoxX family protein [Bacteroidales bacterium]
MKNNFPITLSWILRILVGLMFILSAFSKMLPAATALDFFAKQIVDIGVANWCFAPLLARAIVGFELFLGLALFQNHYLKKLIIPATFLLLLAFCIHLTITIFTTGNIGSCGCFGDLIPMTPMEAIIKNLIAMAMLAWLYFKVSPKINNRLVFPLIIFILNYLGIFIFLPPTINCSTVQSSQEIVADSLVTKTDTITVSDTLTDEAGKQIITDKVIVEEKKIVVEERAKVKSIFSKYTAFNTGPVDLNEGRKIVCLYSFDCEHCQESSKLLLELKNNHINFPSVYMLAFGEESQSTDFFKGAGGHIPYVVVEPQEFFQLLGEADYPPRIVVMDNGNFLGDFMNFEHLDTAAVMRAVRR